MNVRTCDGTCQRLIRARSVPTILLILQNNIDRGQHTKKGWTEKLKKSRLIVKKSTEKSGKKFRNIKDLNEYL